MLGQPVRVVAQTNADGSVAFSARGQIDAAAAGRFYALPVHTHLSGRTPWSSEIRVRGRSASVKVESTLEGISSSLPAPFNKSALDRWPLRVELDLQPAGAEDRLRLALGDILTGELYAGGAHEQWRVRRGAVALGQPLELPEQGLAVDARFAELDLDAWRKALADDAPPAADPALAGRSSAFVPDRLHLSAARLRAFGHDFHALDLQARPVTGGWGGRLKGREAEGEFRWLEEGEGALSARMKRLELAAGEVPPGSEPGAQGARPTRSLPALDVHVDDFRLRDKRFGQLDLQARNHSGAWLLEKVALASPDGRLDASGRWTTGAAARTELDFVIDTADVGSLLTRLGYVDAVRRGKARLEGKVMWAGAPIDIDYPSLAGSMQLDASGGQFNKLEPGVGRLLGVLSLQSLPRRITLDFRDVFSEGFAFDRISGSIDVDHGVLRTDDFEIRGPAARVALSGAANVSQETQDLVVRVQPTLSESVAVGATLLNPVAGVVTYLAQKALADPIEKFFAYKYRVTGTWSDPQVEKLSASPKADGAKPEAVPAR
jgi:uncharacterized protein (TIGR02099 family)